MYHVLLSNLSILVTFKRNWVINYSIKTERRDLSSSMGKITKEIFTVAWWLCQAHHTPLDSWELSRTWCFHQGIGIDVNPELWCTPGPYEGHPCRCSLWVWFSIWWWWIKSKCLLARAPVSSHCVSGAFSRILSYEDFSTWPSVVVDKRKRKQQPFPQALLRLWKKCVELEWRTVSGHLHSTFCFVICPSPSHFLSLWGKFCKTDRNSLLLCALLLWAPSPWQVWIYYTVSLMHLFPPLQQAVRVSPPGPLGPCQAWGDESREMSTYVLASIMGGGKAWKIPLCSFPAGK